MRLVTTAALGAAVVALSAAIHRVDHQPLAGRRAAALAKVLLRFDPETADRLVVERGDAKTVMERRGEDWFFAEPEQDRVDAVAAAAVLDRLNHLGVVDDLGSSGVAPDPAVLGLAGERAIRITVSGKGSGGAGGFSETAVLGIEAPRTGSIYARRDDGRAGKEAEGVAFVVDGNPRPWLEDPLEAMRDRRALGAPVGALTELAIRTASGDLALRRRIEPPAQDWALVSPLASWADREAMDRLLAALASLRIDEVSGPAEGISVPDEIPEGAALVQAKVHGADRPLLLYLREVRKAEDGTPLLELRASDRPHAYRLASGFLGLLPGSPDELRDRRLARLPQDRLAAIRIQSGVDPDVDLRAERGAQDVSWKVVLGNRLVAANGQEVNRLVATLNETEVLDFAGNKEEELERFGLRRPHRRLLFQLEVPGEAGPDGTPGPARELVRVLHLGSPADEPQRLFANFEGEPYAYELDPSFLSAIPTHPVKWKSLKVLTFNPMHLVSITRDKAEKENLKLAYDYRRDRWEVSRSGLDVTSSLDIASARRLRDRLGSLTATGWYLSLGTAYEALRSPSVEFAVVTMELDRATGEPQETIRRLRFAPSVGDLYFGQIEGSPDVFFVDRETYGDLIRDVTTTRMPAP